VPAERWDPWTTLTRRQRELLSLAFQLGYYESPAKVSLDRLGQLVGISRAAFSKHLRRAEKKVLETVVGSPR
jgi:predicted DNA binding protein